MDNAKSVDVRDECNPPVVDRIVCRELVVIDDEGRERITLNAANGCAVVEVSDGIPNHDGAPASVSLSAERGGADVYVSNGARAVRLDWDGVEMKVFDDDSEELNRNTTRWATLSAMTLEDLGIDAIKAIARLIKRLPDES